MSGRTRRRRSTRRCIFPICSASASIFPCVRPGNALLSVAPDLLVDQINEIGIDLTRELESGQEQISCFIPPYLGRLLCLLPEKELGESVESIGKLACGASIRPARVALFTLWRGAECAAGAGGADR